MYAEQLKIILTDTEAEQIIRKVARHFKVKVGTIRFRGIRDRGYASWSDNAIRLNHSPNIETLCHEVSHHFERQHHNNKRHDKRLTRTIGRLLNYCAKKDYWESFENE